MPKKILLVEDEAIIAMNTAQMIEKHGFKVVTAYKGEKAVEAVDSDPEISLILMDIDLGKGIDGTEAAQEILKKRDIPIVFHTSHAEKEYVDRVKKITGYGYVLKNSGEFVILESINMAYTLFEAKKEAQLNQKESEIAYQEMEAREYRLQHVNRVLLSIRNINQIITKETDIPTLLDKACRLLIETSGYHKAWIVLTNNGVPQEPFYHSGFKKDFSSMESLLKAGTLPQCAKEALDTHDIHIVNEPSTECPLCPFKDQYSEDNCGYDDKVTMTMPLIINEVAYGWISVILSTFYSENADEHKLFREIARDLAYALNNLKIEETQRLLARDLNLTQATLMAALDNSHAGIAIADAPDGKLRFVNDAALRIRGGNRKERDEGGGIDQYIASWTILDLDGTPLAPDEVPLARALMYGEINSRQFIVRRDNIEDRIVMANAAPIYDEEGKIDSAMVIFIDITEHKKTERKLIESEEKYKALYENAPLPYQSLDRDGNFIDVNPAWLTTLGYMREEVIGNKFADFLHPSWKPHFEKNFPAFKKRGYVHDVQFKIRHKSGEYRDITFEGCIGYKPDGSVRQTYCVFKDITEQKQAEEELKEGRENLRITLNSIGDAVISTDTDGNVVHMNPIAEHRTGWEIDSAKNKDLREVLHIINAETRESVDNPVDKVMQTGEIIGLANHTILISENGHEYQIADSAAPIKDEEGNINGVVLVFRDVTEEYEKDRQLKKKNYLLEETQHLAHIGSWELDLTTNQLSWSDEIYRIFGLQPQEFGANYEAFIEAVYSEDRKTVDEAYTNSIKQNHGGYEIDHRIVRKNTGEILYVHEKCMNVKDENGTIIRSIGMVQDITERKWAEEAFRESKKEISSIFRSAPVGIGLVVDRVLKAVNRRVCRITGYEEHELIGQSARILYLSDDDFEFVGREKYAQIEEHGTGSVEIRWQKKDGSVIYVLLSSSPVDLKDRSKGVTFTALDITDRKRMETALIESEEKHRRLFETSVQGVIYQTSDGTIISANPAATKILGLSLDRMIGKKVENPSWEMIREDGSKLPVTEHPVAVVLRTGQKTGPVNLGVFHPEKKSYSWLSITAIPQYREGETTPFQVYSVFEDITERKHKDEKLRLALEEKTFLMRELNHRVKNSLLMISSLISLKDAETEIDLSDIQHQIKAIGLIHEKLNQTENVTEISCRDYFEDLLNSIFFSFTTQQVKVKKNIDDEYVSTKTALALGLIINEIATNAIKYGFSEKEEAVFTIEMRTNKENTQYELTLSNTGNPFPEDIDIESTDTLGLRLINSLVAQLDGTIELQKKPYPMFTIEVPVEN